ncbi:MAG: DNA polymerase III subunit beta [Candidatus Falkowbacteria bacterium]|nr:DNA polymerase III subunit beta [Candidatus Falkowbacteria bacterium]
MKISALQENIKRGISIVGHASGKNPNLPILSNILFDVKDGEIKLIATNLEIGIVNKVRGKIDQDGSIAVDAKMILDYISLLPNQKVNIETKDNNLLIESENYKTKIIGKNADDFPLIPKVDQEKNFSATINDFKKALSSIIFATSTSETRLELTGVFFEFSEKELIMAATDSFRLSEKKIVIIKHFKNNEEDDSNNKMKLIIPSKTLQELSRVLSVISESELNDEDDGRINFYISDNQVLFKFLNTELVSRLIDGQFPDYTQIIPVKSTTQILINKNNLIRAIKSSAIFTKTGANDINLDFIKADNKTIISASSGAVGENIVEIETVIDGEDNKVIVNYKYLLDQIKRLIICMLLCQ